MNQYYHILLDTLDMVHGIREARRKGRDELVKGMLRSSQRNPGGRTLTVESVRFVAPGVALADARYVIAGAAGREPRRMWSTFLAVRSADGWRLTAIRNMLPAR